MRNLREILCQHLVDLDPSDITVCDSLDGRGEYITEWNSQIAQPTDEQIKQWHDEYHGEAGLIAIAESLAAQPPAVTAPEENSESNIPLAIEDLARRKKTQVNEWRAEALQSATVDHEGHRWQVDETSRSNLQGVVLAAMAGVSLPEDFTWRSADDIDVPMQIEQLVSLGATMTLFVNDIYRHSWVIKARIDQFLEDEDREGIETITWE